MHPPSPCDSKRQVAYPSLFSLVTILLFFALIPTASQAETNPPIGLLDSNYRDTSERWTANVADASQCKSFSALGVSFAPNGYAEIDGGLMKCFGTQTLTYSDGRIEILQNAIWLTSLSCGADQSINPAGEILKPVSYPTSGHSYSSATCYCYRYLQAWNGSACTSGGAQNIAFLEGASTSLYPAGTGGFSEGNFRVRVTEGGTPKPGVAVSFSVDVTANSGGHEHHDPNRPKGSLSGTQGTTDANGEVRLTFTAPEVAGIHTVKVACATCSNSPVSKEVQVKVPDLLPISPNAPQNADGTFVYALTSVDKTHQGNGRYHHNQYYVTEQSRQNLRAMISDFAAEGWGTVALNDASLFWGGRYDINASWGQPTSAKEPHAGHREGREIDISFARANNPISASKQSDFYDKFCKNKKVSFPFSILHHYVKNPHFHVYLEKQTACWKSGK